MSINHIYEYDDDVDFEEDEEERKYDLDLNELDENSILVIPVIVRT